MVYNAFKAKDELNIIEEYFELFFNEDMISFNTTITPVALPLITYIKKENAIIEADKNLDLHGLMLTGLFSNSYPLKINEEASSIGIALHPTALYKLIGYDVSKLKNNHIPLKEVSKDLHHLLLPLFESELKDKIALEAIKNSFKSMPLLIDKHTKNVDQAIKLIRKKEGLLKVSDLLKEIPVSQKTLETTFKRIVGITPGKYMKLFRFIRLMRRYVNQNTKIKDLIFMYDYYDESHFTKDFKLFMRKSPKEYFQEDYIFAKEYLKK